jgi:hypothetical protein
MTSLDHAKIKSEILGDVVEFLKEIRRVENESFIAFS